VAGYGHLDEPLGHKGTHGILATQTSRALFLADSSHRIRFVYTPKHCSWLNQIEIWFSILVRRLLKRSSFKSTLDLQKQISLFVAYFNETMPKPFKWTYAGKPLCA
jgi:transposase